MKEIELKILEIDEAKVLDRLKSIGAKQLSTERLTTITFNNPYNNVLVRLRKIGNKTILTTKKPIFHKDLKVREETEVEVDDFDKIFKILETLGFKQAMLQEKDRTSFKYKNSTIVIDKYPKIPVYLEVEGAEEEIKEIVKELGYSMEDTTKINVYRLFKEYGVDAKEMRF